MTRSNSWENGEEIEQLSFFQKENYKAMPRKYRSNLIIILICLWIQNLPIHEPIES